MESQELELIDGWETEDLYDVLGHDVHLDHFESPKAARLRVALRHGGSQPALVAFAEALLHHEEPCAPASTADPIPSSDVGHVPKERHACRICLEGEQRELLDCCACRGSVRFICEECLLLQFETQPEKAHRCGLCLQAFSGRAQQLLTERMTQHLAKRKEESQDVQDLELLKQQVTTATGLWQQGILHEAAALFQETIEGLRQHCDAKGQLYSAQHNLSLVLVALGQPKEAREQLRTARRGLALLYGAEHPLVLKAAHNEAMAANAAGDREEGRTLYEVTFEARQRVLGCEHVDTLKTRCNLGLALRNAGRPAEAEAELRATWQALQRVMGPRHPLALTIMQNLSLALASRAKSTGQSKSSCLAALQAAVLLAQEAVQGKQRMLGFEHFESLEALRDFGALQAELGRNAEAHRVWRQTLAGLQRSLGFQHPTTLAVLQQLRSELPPDEAWALEQDHRAGCIVSALPWPPCPLVCGRLTMVVHLVAVAPDHRGCGLGSRLLQHFKKVAQEAHLEVKLPDEDAEDSDLWLGQDKRCSFKPAALVFGKDASCISLA
ncbi:unnamed protein product [Cladocopium goreaui]|uniref:N-acetyltransferase domain-containing protein n=1 Tax=Cladocopium goreaui TaxID=2562237 RepID=A0A9P1FPK4_9DINO|nr:unnamed protein product [Cladocopium goreaui]